MSTDNYDNEVFAKLNQFSKEDFKEWAVPFLRDKVSRRDDRFSHLSPRLHRDDQLPAAVMKTIPHLKKTAQELLAQALAEILEEIEVVKKNADIIHWAIRSLNVNGSLAPYVPFKEIFKKLVISKKFLTFERYGNSIHFLLIYWVMKDDVQNIKPFSEGHFDKSMETLQVVKNILQEKEDSYSSDFREAVLSLVN